MAGHRKIDNRSLQSKVTLRKWLLTRMGFTSVSVLDACAGEGRIWTEMENHVKIARWVRCDIKPRAGGNGMTLKLSASQSMSAMDLDEFNVIDIDTYGEPWEPYRILLSKLNRPTAVFLTHGHVVLGGDVTDATKRANSLPPDWRIPQLPTVVDYLARRCLEATWNTADILHAGTVYSPPGQGRAAVAYYGLGLRPKLPAKEAALPGGA